MQESSKLRRCCHLLLEPRERVGLDVPSLLSGGRALRASTQWLALAPHIGVEVEVDLEELAALGLVEETRWQSRRELVIKVSPAVLDRLQAKGLVVSDDERVGSPGARDSVLREQQWRTTSLICHSFSRWKDIGLRENQSYARQNSTDDLVRDFGLPPPHMVEKVSPELRAALPQSRTTPLDSILRGRATCRNFDTDYSVDLQTFSDMTQRVFGCHAEVEVVPGVWAQKKSNPSGGGLHPTEIYVLTQRVEGVEPGVYHYHATSHSLEPMQVLSRESARALAMQFVAGQDYFADAPVMFILTSRFLRTNWKYRNHAKAYRVALLEVGHISQNMYIAATELGFGAFITAAINEIPVDEVLGIDGTTEGSLAVLGFGKRSESRSKIELDPLGSIWGEPTPSGSRVR